MVAQLNCIIWTIFLTYRLNKVRELDCKYGHWSAYIIKPFIFDIFLKFYYIWFFSLLSKNFCAVIALWVYDSVHESRKIGHLLLVGLHFIVTFVVVSVSFACYMSCMWMAWSNIAKGSSEIWIDWLSFLMYDLFVSEIAISQLDQCLQYD